MLVRSRHSRPLFAKRSGLLTRLPAFALLVVGALWTPALLPAQAPEAEEQRQVIGPYLVDISPSRLRTSPGHQLFLITVLDAEQGGAVSDADVTIRTHNETSGHSGWAVALNTATEPQLFRAIVNVDAAGLWRFSIEIASPLGTETVDLPPVTVEGNQQSVGGYLVYGLVIGAILFGVFYLRRQSKRLTAGLASKEDAARR